MLMNSRYLLPLRANGLRFFSSFPKSSFAAVKTNNPMIFDPSETEKICAEISSVNSRLQNLQLTAQYLAGRPLLKLPTINPKTVVCPTTQIIEVKRFIVEQPKEVKEPEVVKKQIKEPLSHAIVKKHAIRMIVLRRRKMKKHQLKKLWQRMYLKFRANRQAREKKKEYEFRGKLAAKVADARKFSAQKYVEDYLNDYHTPLLPKTYKGKRLPEWLIKELLEQDKEHVKETALRGKELTTAQDIVKPGESVKDFIARTWNKTSN
eukprot:GFUD01023014.1.p1 GENE.GFUD01023014.1~~GFUD01023014.1.p1  ORF type:complete len:282 (+),score=70.50 GFUD01023014.1:60-848(+)